MARLQLSSDCVFRVRDHLAHEPGLGTHRGKEIWILRSDGYSGSMSGFNAGGDRLEVFEVCSAEGAPMTAIDWKAAVKQIVRDAGILGHTHKPQTESLQETVPMLRN